MPTFSERSLKNLAEAHPDIQRVMHEAIKNTPIDFVVIEGFRSEAEQNEAFRKGASKARFGQSAHNYRPAAAVDIVPYPNYFNASREEWRRLGEHIVSTAKLMNVPLRWGADWNMNGNYKDERFVDSPHFELHPWRDFVK